MFIQDTTIAALATPLGQAPLSIIRVSGQKTFTIISQIFRSKKSVLESIGHEVIFGYIFDPKDKQDIDQVLIAVFKAPRSFTGEDMVEITCHGGMILFQKILNILVRCGCVLAAKGEFSKRAFINGKMDLTQAEAIHDLIFSRSHKMSQLILSSLKKNFSLKIQEIKTSILNLVAKIEVSIDYPEDDIEAWNQQDMITLENILVKLQKMMVSAKQNQLANKGYVVAIIGKPNAGKSSLLNLLVGEEKAIVSSIAGTTRDPIEVFLNINEIPVTLIDTAGLRESADNEIEEKGIAKTKDIILTSDFNILLVDSHSYNIAEVEDQIHQLQQENSPFMLIWNKIDLVQNFPKIPTIPEKQQLALSCQTQTGLDKLIEELQSRLSYIDTTESQFFINQRQSYLLEQVEYTLHETWDMIKSEHIDLEILSLLLQKALHTIGEIDGSDIQDDILETIFSQFCVGK